MRILLVWLTLVAAVCPAGKCPQLLAPTVDEAVCVDCVLYVHEMPPVGNAEFGVQNS